MDLFNELIKTRKELDEDRMFVKAAKTQFDGQMLTISGYNAKFLRMFDEKQR